MYAFDVDPCPKGWTGEFVLRIVGSPQQAGLEAGLHTAAAAEDLGPRLLLEASGAGIAGGYLVMERFPHRSCVRGVEPARFVLDLPKLVAAWPRRVAGVIGALGQVDPDEVRRCLEVHSVDPELVVQGRHLRAVQSALGDEPALQPAIDWLHEHQPSPPERLAFVHGDLWPGNVFLGRSGPRLIDWTRGGVDDPALDVGFAKVGFALMPEPFPPPSPIREAVHGIGSSMARRISARCDRLVGGGERVRYYEALRCAVELSGVVDSAAPANGPVGSTACQPSFGTCNGSPART